MILTVRKKPVVVQAILWTGDNWDEIIEWCPYGLSLMSSREGLKIETLEGNLHVTKGDYIIKGVEGEYYPCKPKIFKATYETLNAEKAERCPITKDFIRFTCSRLPKMGRSELKNIINMAIDRVNGSLSEKQRYEITRDKYVAEIADAILGKEGE